MLDRFGMIGLILNATDLFRKEMIRWRVRGEADYKISAIGDIHVPA